MKRILFLLFSLAMGSFSALFGQGFVNEAVRAEWPLDDKPLTLEGVVNRENAFSTATLSYGKMTIRDVITTNGTSFVRFVPAAEVPDKNVDCALTFTVFPSAGVTFTPSQISLKALQYGTGNGRFMVVGKKAGGEETILVGETTPGRGDKNEATTEITAPISDINIKGTAYTITIYVYKMATNKQIGFSDVIISGVVNGEKKEVPAYTVTTSVLPQRAGTVSVTPEGTSFDEETTIMLSATRQFGYQFTNWTDATGKVLSTESPLVHKVTTDVTIIANFETIPTYSLDLRLEGEANEYMVEVTPAGTLIDGKRMYEAGAEVALKAISNPVVAFLQWEDHSTVADRNIVMDANQQLTATYEAADYVVGWDFYKKGGANRIADFASTTDNEIAVLVLRQEDGSTTGWLDKSIEAAGGYDGLGAALVWKDITERYYFQTKVNASDFQNITISSQMWYNYQAYSVQQLQWSLNGTEWKTATTATMINKTWVSLQTTLPTEANNAPMLYLRWIPDYTSAFAHATEKTNGTGLGAVYITGTKQLINPGVPPKLLSSTPMMNATDVSASGKVILKFDAKVKVTEVCTAVLGLQKLTPQVVGSTASFAYMGLDYDKEYTFTLAGQSITDLSGNVLTDPIILRFSTLKRPVVNAKLFDYVVKAGDANDLKAALVAANADKGTNRYRIFLPAGDYNLGVGYGTPIRRSKVSLIGADMETTIIRNTPPEPGIGITATLFIDGASETYMQDITLKSDWPYVAQGGGVAVCLQDKGDKTVLKQVKMLSYQDTYFSDNRSMRSYLDECEIHGTVDFICGGGDVFFNRNLFYLEERSGNVIAAPRGDTKWGYVFNDCTIAGAEINKGSYCLGRPWAEAPRAVYLNTTMKIAPAAAGWTHMGPLPALFAEYNSRTESGTAVDCSGRKKSYKVNDVDTPYEGPTVLTDAQATEYTVGNVLGGADGWMPMLATEQVQAPIVGQQSSTLTWKADVYALCYLIYKDGVYLEQTVENHYSLLSSGVYMVYAVNEMGGLSVASHAVRVNDLTGITAIPVEDENTPIDIYRIDGRLIRKQMLPIDALKGLEKGVYVSKGKKFVIQ